MRDVVVDGEVIASGDDPELIELDEHVAELVANLKKRSHARLVREGVKLTWALHIQTGE